MGVILLAIVLCGAYVFWEKHKNNATHGMPKIARRAIEPMSPDIKRVMAEISGQALSKDKQEFENIIHELLLVSPDDKKGGFGSRIDINMKAREKYFSAESYPAYVAYVEQQKKDIRALGVDSGAPYTCHALFKYGSQKYTKEAQGAVVFFANGRFLCGAWDSRAEYGRYKIEVKTKSDVMKPDNLVLDVWDVEVLEPVRPKVP